MKSLPADSKDNTKMNSWLPGIVGAGLAILFMGAVSFMPISTIAMGMGVLAVIAIAFF